MLIRTSKLERWGILVAIWALRAITPISFFHFLLAAFLPNYILRQYHTISAYALIECTFYLFIYLPRKRHLQKAAVHPPRMSSSERRDLVRRCQSHIVDPEDFIQGWYLDSTSADKTIRRENVIEWLLWGFFSSGREALDEPGVAEEIEEYLQLHEKTLGQKFPPGRNPGVKSIRTTLDEVVILHRPVIWYLIICLLDILTAIILRRCGFKHYSIPIPIFPPRPYTLFSTQSPAPRLSYWYYPASSPKPSAGSFPPFVFIHGIGIGLLPYISLLIGYARKHSDVPIIVPELLSISSRITRPPLSHEEFQGELQKIFEYHDIREYSIAAHSYGTVLTAGIIRTTNSNQQPKPSEATDPAPSKSPNSRAPLPAPCSVTLLDPIPLLLHLPSVARNFLYRPPGHANEHEIYYFACTDPGVAHALSRHFFWTHNILWKEELAHIGTSYNPKPRVAVMLSGEDIIVDSPAVWTYLTGLPPPELRCQAPRPFIPPVAHPESFVPTVCEEPNVLAVYLGGLDHAQMFLRQESWKGVVDIVDRVSAIEETS